MGHPHLGAPWSTVLNYLVLPIAGEAGSSWSAPRSSLRSRSRAQQVSGTNVDAAAGSGDVV
jgi:hypothetical protein